MKDRLVGSSLQLALSMHMFMNGHASCSITHASMRAGDYLTGKVSNASGHFWPSLWQCFDIPPNLIAYRVSIYEQSTGMIWDGRKPVSSIFLCCGKDFSNTGNGASGFIKELWCIDIHVGLAELMVLVFFTQNHPRHPHDTPSHPLTHEGNLGLLSIDSISFHPPSPYITASHPSSLLS